MYIKSRGLYKIEENLENAEIIFKGRHTQNSGKLIKTALNGDAILINNGNKMITVGLIGYNGSFMDSFDTYGDIEFKGGDDLIADFSPFGEYGDHFVVLSRNGMVTFFQIFLANGKVYIGKLDSFELVKTGKLEKGDSIVFDVESKILAVSLSLDGIASQMQFYRVEVNPSDIEFLNAIELGDKAVPRIQNLKFVKTTSRGGLVIGVSNRNSPPLLMIFTEDEGIIKMADQDFFKEGTGPIEKLNTDAGLYGCDSHSNLVDINFE